MDKAQALSESLTIGTIIADLSEVFDSPEPSIAYLLLKRIRLPELGIYCLAQMESDPTQQFRVDLPEDKAEYFLRQVSNKKDDLSNLSHEVCLYKDAPESDGEWEMFDCDAGFGAAAGPLTREYRILIPFGEFRVPRYEYEQRLNTLDTSEAKFHRNVLSFCERNGVFHVGLEGVSVRDWTDFPEGFYDIRDFFRLDGAPIWAWRFMDRILAPTPEGLASGDIMGLEYQPAEDGGPQLGTWRFHDDGIANDNINDDKTYKRTAKLLEEQAEELQGAEESGADDGVIFEMREAHDLTRKNLNQANGYFNSPNSLEKPPYLIKKERLRSRLNSAIKALEREGQHEIAKYIKSTIKVRNETKYEAPEENAWQIRTEPPGGSG